MISSLRLQPEESAAFLALAKKQSTLRQLLVSERSDPIYLKRSRRLTAILRLAIRAARGCIVDNRLEWIGGALVHDHSDRQFARLVAEVDGGGLEDRRLWRSRDTGIRPAARVFLSILLNAHGVQLFSPRICHKAAEGMAKGLVVLALLQNEYRRYGPNMKSIVVSFDFSPTRLALFVHGKRSGISIAGILHHYAADWDEVRVWHRVASFDYILCHRIEHAERIQPPPSAVCLLTNDYVFAGDWRTDSLTAGIVVDNFVSPEATIELARRIADEAAVTKVVIRRHPGAKMTIWPPPDHPEVAYAETEEGLNEFADRVDFVVGSRTTAMFNLRAWGVPCLSWSYFYRGKPYDFGEMDGLAPLGQDLAEGLSSARELAKQVRSAPSSIRLSENSFSKIEPRELVKRIVG